MSHRGLRVHVTSGQTAGLRHSPRPLCAHAVRGQARGKLAAY